MLYKSKIAFVLLLVSLLASMSPASSRLTLNDINGAELTLPKRNDVQIPLYSKDSGNDIFFRSTVDNAILSHAYTSTDSPFQLYSYNGMDRTNNGFYNPITDNAMAPDVTSLYQANNQSALPLDLTYTVTYYDLTSGTSDKDGLKSILLFESEMSGFRFQATSGEPLILDMKIKGQTEQMSMNLYLVSPTGMVYDYSAFTTQFNTFVNDFVPIVPDETGNYTVYMSPIGDDIILTSLNIYDSPPVISIESGHQARWTGLQTQTIFFKFTLNASSDGPQLLKMASQLFLNTSIPFADQAFLLGSMDIKYFNAQSGPFGANFPDTVLQWKSNSTFVAITATPPNESNQFVAAKKAELGIAPGFDVDYAFYAEKYDLNEFELNKDYNIDPTTSVSSNVYYFNTTQDYIIGVNSTTAASVFIVNLDDQTVGYSLNSGANDILHSASDAPTLLPAGNYSIAIVGASGNDVRVHTVTPLTIGIGDTATRGFRLGQPVFYKLAVPFPTKENFNFTYQDFGKINASVTLNFRFYNSMLTPLGSVTQYQFNEYYNSGGNRISANTTVVGDTSFANLFNVEVGYFRVELSTNTIRDTLGAPSSTDNSTITSVFTIHRQNYLDVWAENVDNQYVTSTLAQSLGAASTINGSKSILYVYSFISASTMAGYRFHLDAVNATYQVRVFTDWTNSWFTLNSGPAININGVTHHMLDIEFGSTEETVFGIIVQITSAVNGTLTRSFTEVQVQDTPGVTLGTLNAMKYNPPYNVNEITSGGGSSSNFIDDYGLTIGVAVIVIAAAAGTFVFIRKKRG